MNIDAYFICTTPRTGSTFLCSLLKSTKIAGNPESYFRSQDKNKWASRWGLLNHAQKIYDFEDYLQACLKAGCTRNNLFACRLMWETMNELISDINSVSAKSQLSHKQYLEQVFGNTKFVYLKRNDFVAQAVSRLRAEQTDIWHLIGFEQMPNCNDDLEYDALKIHNFIREAEEHNEAWEEWFANNNVKPNRIIYEDLIKNPEGQVKAVLEFSELPVNGGLAIESENKKMADEISIKWIEKFKSEEL